MNGIGWTPRCFVDGIAEKEIADVVKIAVVVAVAVKEIVVDVVEGENLWLWLTRSGTLVELVVVQHLASEPAKQRGFYQPSYMKSVQIGQV